MEALTSGITVIAAVEVKSFKSYKGLSGISPQQIKPLTFGEAISLSRKLMSPESVTDRIYISVEANGQGQGLNFNFFRHHGTITEMNQKHSWRTFFTVTVRWQKIKKLVKVETSLLIVSSASVDRDRISKGIERKMHVEITVKR